jgi:hypothetical protein
MFYGEPQDSTSCRKIDISKHLGAEFGLAAFRNRPVQGVSESLSLVSRNLAQTIQKEMLVFTR